MPKPTGQSAHDDACSGIHAGSVMHTSASERRSPITFMACVAGVMLPIAYVLGHRQLVLQIGHVSVPATVCLTLVPISLALAFTFAENGSAGASALLRRLLPNRRIGLRWYVVAVLLHPALQVVAYFVAVALGRQYEEFTPLATLWLVVPALVFAIAEEVGWTGYATDPMQQRWGPLGAALTIGLVEAGIHLVPYVQEGRAAAWIIGQSTLIVGLRIVKTWVFNNTDKSILPVVLLHTSYNIGYIMYPYQGSHYDPVILSALVWVPVVAVLLRSRMWSRVGVTPLT